MRIYDLIRHEGVVLEGEIKIYELDYEGETKHLVAELTYADLEGAVARDYIDRLHVQYIYPDPTTPNTLCIEVG